MPPDRSLGWVVQEETREINYYSKQGFKLDTHGKRMCDIKRAYYLMAGDKEEAEKHKVDTRHEYTAKLKTRIITASEFVEGSWV